MRVASRKSISELAVAIKVPEPVLEKLENSGVVSDRDVLSALATYYGISLETLLGD